MKSQRKTSVWKCAYCGTPSVITLANKVEDLTSERDIALAAMQGAMYSASKAEAERDALKELLREFTSVPRNYDKATMPRDGFLVENEQHRKQCIVNLSVSYDRLYRAEQALSGQEVQNG